MPDEVKALLGPPERQHTRKDGDGRFLVLDYPGVQSMFGQLGGNSPYTLLRITVQGTPLDIGEDKIITLRTSFCPTGCNADKTGCAGASGGGGAQ